MDKEVNELCEILDDYKVTADRDMPEEFWNKCKKEVHIPIATIVHIPYFVSE